MLRVILASFMAFAAPAGAATIDVPLTFTGEVFQDVFDFESGRIDSLSDGSKLGFQGAFPGLAPGEATEARIELAETPGMLPQIVSCTFAGLNCKGGMIERSRDGQSLSILDYTGPSFVFDFDRGTATYVEDGPGGGSDLGFFKFYRAEFAIGDLSASREDTRIAVVSLPYAAAMLLSGLALFGIARRRSRT